MRHRTPPATYPGTRAGRALRYEAARPPIWSCSGWGLPCHRRCRRRGALLPHHFTLTDPPRRIEAVSFLWHLPWARAPQALPGTLPCGARTFLSSRAKASEQRLSSRLPDFRIARKPGSRGDKPKAKDPRGWRFGQGCPRTLPSAPVLILGCPGRPSILSRFWDRGLARGPPPSLPTAPPSPPRPGPAGDSAKRLDHPSS